MSQSSSESYGGNITFAQSGVNPWLIGLGVVAAVVVLWLLNRK